jgi:hypothetical protein
MSTGRSTNAPRHSHGGMSSPGFHDHPEANFAHDVAPPPAAAYAMTPGPPCSVNGVQQQGMAAARSAVLEMQRQGLSVQNIQDLLQNMQSLLSTLPVRCCSI